MASQSPESGSLKAKHSAPIEKKIQDLNSSRKLYVQKGGGMDMASLMGGIKDRTSKEFLVMQSFQLEKMWVRLS